MDTPLTVYDELRYPGRFYPYATAERLATIAALYGLDSAPVTRCRVLELACGEGGNLIPQALVFPDSEFFGIDLAATSIERGRALAEQVGLRNIQLRAQDLLEFPRDAGTFDYIVAHGLYSWVPERVREEILEICSRHLAPRGLAYISYNALPGGHFKQYARDLMLFHTRFFSDPGVKVREARNIIDFVTVAHPHASPERESLRREMAPYENYDSFLFHDLLAETNESVYFLDFMDQAARRGLQFVSEATLENFLVNQWPDSLRRQIESLGDRLLQEQYRDFIGCRRFRRTVLCRAGHDLDPHLRPERMKQFTFVSALHPVKPIKDLHDGEMVDFRTASGHTIASDQAMPKALYLELGDAWPHALTYDELLGQVVRRVGIDPGELDDENLGRFHRLLLSSFANGVVIWHIVRPIFALEVSDRPVASPLARAMADSDGPIPSLSLSVYSIGDPLQRRVLKMLDGSRDLAQIVAELQRESKPEEFPEISVAAVKQAVQTLAYLGFLSA